MSSTDPTAPLRLVAGRHPRIWSSSFDADAGLPMTASVIEQIRASVGALPAESGGMLGGSRLDGVVRTFAFDDHPGGATAATYTPRHELLTRVLREQWNPRGVQLLGFVHSHPSGFRRPSGPDIDYAQRFLARNDDLDRMLLPIVTSAADHDEFAMAGFAVGRDGGPARAVPRPVTVVADAEPIPTEPHAAFARVQSAYDLDRLARTRLVVVGAGGAAAFVEDMCRAGVGEVVLVDPDLVEPANVGTQMVRLRDAGTPKVASLARRLVEVSPVVTVAAVHASTDDLTDQDLTRLATARIGGHARPEVSLVCGFTDSFAAQARVARLALHLGLPSLAAQVYAEGRGAEISFALPGRTPACQRCALGSRYRAYRDGYRNDVGSGGTPIFATTRLNSLKGFVALALLHGAGSEPASGAGGHRWLRLLDRIGNRNLIMIRMDPDLATTVGLGQFDRALSGADAARIVTDETLWLPQEPESPATGFEPCGDCGGTGDLRDAIGTLPVSHLDLAVGVS